MVEYGYYVTKLYGSELSTVTRKFDTGASCSMSGIPNRIHQDLVQMDQTQVQIAGFNGSRSLSHGVGLNADFKKEYYVPSMPKDLVLLSGHQYASDGAAILHKYGGKILQLTDSQLQNLLEFIKQYQTRKTLKVVNRTYEIDKDHDHKQEIYPTADDEVNLDLLQDFETPSNQLPESAYSNTATKFFNSKVNVSNSTDRILTLLLSGFSFDDWKSHVKNKSLDGIPPDVTTKALDSFERKYGKTPDIIR